MTIPIDAIWHLALNTDDMNSIDSVDDFSIARISEEGGALVMVDNGKIRWTVKRPYLRPFATWREARATAVDDLVIQAEWLSARAKKFQEWAKMMEEMKDPEVGNG